MEPNNAMPPKAAKKLPEGEIRRVPPKQLRFDLRNPRYGPRAVNQKSDRQALDYIVAQFDVNDLLSSMSVNGFFDSEPLVGIETKDGIQILEGNRRLAACLILAGDERAKGQIKRKHAYPLRPGVKFDTVPVIVYNSSVNRAKLLPYLGVRHIVGGTEWDSYAKAHWIAETIGDTHNALTLDEIKAMIGDNTGLVERLLTSYHLVQQLEDEDLFEPADSIKRGRGSAEFPFSLIYNALDISSLRKWLGLPEGKKATRKNPVPPDRLNDAATLVRMICGSKRDDFAPSIQESRDLRDLAEAVRVPELFSRLKRGQSLREVVREIYAANDRILENLTAAMEPLEDSVTLLTKTPLSSKDAQPLVSTAKKVRRLSAQAAELLEKQASEGGEDDEK